MAASGTYNFSPPAIDLVLNGFSRIQIRPTELTTMHLNDAATEANLLMVQISNRQPNTFALQTPTINLVQGTQTYSLPQQTLAIGLIYLTVGTGSSAFDLPLGPLSSTDYAAIPDKYIEARPTSYWFNLSSPQPQVVLWPVPDGSQPYILNVQSFRQEQDISLKNGQNFDAPYRLLDALAAGMSYRLSRIYKRELTQMCKQEWEDAWDEFSRIDEQSVQMNIVCGLQSYFT